MPTEYRQVEPNPGFGKTSFGNPSDDPEEKEYGRGFGDIKTKHNETPDNQK
jgi:hypothetical protein